MGWLSRLTGGRFFPFRKKCALCHRTVPGMRKYMNDQGETIYICPSCSEYAERRAFRKL